MNIPIPLFLARAWHAFVEWGNVLVWNHKRVEIVRIDLLMASCFLLCVALYGALHGVRGAIQGGIAFVILAALSLFVRRS
jgi:hypothetical protein